MVDRLITSYPPPTAPGIYGIISSAGPTVGPSGLGVVALVGKASFGPIATAVQCGSPSAVQTLFGDSSAVGREVAPVSTLANLAREAAIGGAIGFVVVRVSGSTTPGTTAKITAGIMDGASTVVGQLTASYPGAYGNQLFCKIQTVLGSSTQKELVVTRGATVVQDTRFASGANEIDNLAAATIGAPYAIFTKSASGNGVLGALASTQMAGGADPTGTSPTDYTNAFASLSTYAWATLVTDSEDIAGVGNAVKSFVDTETLWGRFRTACVAEPTSVGVSTRYANAALLNSALVRYQGTGFTYPNGDGTYRNDEGYLAAAVDAGIMSTLTPGTSMTWRAVPGATALVTGTPPYDEPTAIINGMGYYKYSATLGIRTGAGISTLVNPATPPVWAIALNPGWKYLEHVATAFGLIGDIGDTWESMVANPDPVLRPPNTPAGRAALVAAANRSAKQYVDNSWIASGDVIVDPAHPSTSNTAYFTFENLVVALRAERLVLALPFGTP